MNASQSTGQEQQFPGDVNIFVWVKVRFTIKDNNPASMIPVWPFFTIINRKKMR